MKIIITFFLCIVFQETFGQKTFPPLNFTLTGQIKNMPDGKIILGYGDYLGNYIDDTAIIKNGRFEFTGQISQPTYAIIKSLPRNDKNYTGIYIEETKQQIYLSNDSFQYARMEGSPTQKDNEILDSIYRQIEKKWNVKDAYEKALADWYSEKDTIMKSLILKKINSLKIFIDSMNNESKSAKISFIESHPTSYVSLDNLFLPLTYLPIDSVRVLYDNLSTEIKQSRSGQELAAKLKLKEDVLVGTEAPNFLATTILGNEIKLSSFRGKYVLLDFWASWCGPCREAIPLLKELYQKYNSSGFEIITISIDGNKTNWEKAVKQENIGNWNNVLVNDEIEKNYENVHLPIPTSILVNKEGTIVWKSEIPDGPVSLDEFLQGIFK